MADQNQNPQNSQNSQTQIPGTLRTLKTDLDIGGSPNPQDRLQQAGNFVQARPNLESAPNLNSEKKDIPSNEVKPKPAYSWSNMSPAQNITPKTDFNLEVKKEATNNISPVPNINETKSGFSVLEDTIDLPLDSKPATDINKPNDNKSNTGVFNLEPKVNNQLVEFNLKGASFQETDVQPKSKSSMKSIISIVVVLVLLVLIGGGVYAFNMSRNSAPAPSQTTDNKTDTNTEPNTNPAPTVVANPLFKDISKVDIVFVDIEPIRQTILSQLSSKKEPLVELNLTKDGNKVALTDVADAFIITIPTDVLSGLQDYWLYGYNQEGIYKLTAVIQLASDKKAGELVANWANSIPRDLSGFSINLPSRIVNTPNIKNTTIVTDSGKSFNNNYYNYTSPADSIDVSSYENYILMASSKDSMRYILKQIP